jgi:hypothetical protein
MNRKQTITLWAGIVVVVLMGVFPPWLYRSGLIGTTYGFLFLPPIYCTLDVGRLLIQWAMVVIVVGGLIGTLRDKPGATDLDGDRPPRKAETSREPAVLRQAARSPAAQSGNVVDATCWRCGEPVAEAAVFCPHCDQILATEQPSEPSFPEVPTSGVTPAFPTLPRAPVREVAALVVGMWWPLVALRGWAVSPSPGSFDTLAGVALFFAPAIIAYFVHDDMRRRPYPLLAGLSPIGWAAWVLLFCPVGFPAYLLLRKDPLTRVVWPRRVLPAATLLVIPLVYLGVGTVAYLATSPISPP